MTTPEAIILVCVAIIVVIAVYLASRSRRTRRLQGRFGPEYDRTVQSEGGRLRAEATLAQREKRVRQFPIRPLSIVQRDRFQDLWREIQARFVDNPRAALVDADRLIREVMSARGYPVEDFDQCAADLSVDHAPVVENYRAGHEVVLRDARGQATTEDLRRAMIHYRTLFDDLIEETLVRAEPVRVRRAG
jgi:hypothetical protein